MTPRQRGRTLSVRPDLSGGLRRGAVRLTWSNRWLGGCLLVARQLRGELHRRLRALRDRSGSTAGTKFDVACELPQPIVAPMTWSNFVTDIELERDTLLRAMPLVPPTASGGARGTLDVAADQSSAVVSAHDASVTPERCSPTTRTRSGSGRSSRRPVVRSVMPSWASPSTARGRSTGRSAGR
jgi:hypothetical protein